MPAAPATLPEYVLRRSRRARRITVRVDPDRGLVVTIPARATIADAEAGIRELHGWIAPRLAQLEHRRAAAATEAAAGLPYLGTVLDLEPQAGRRRVHRVGDRLLVPADGETRGPALAAWYRTRARDECRGRLDAATATLGVGYERLRITDTRSRWGSCSSTGTISLSWRLLLAPEACLDYVVWHEACHVVHAHHGPTFWALLERHVPDWREPAAWLRANGTDLRLLLPA
ncbi:M48 family metallopeptidase [Patulibacter minatonensis]|uniref:M48 family metallopeptidase n=1 Tax=Patulibacter minatonensis TaxID=298163 RepID=UPI0004B1093B|nr:SprT family zinc-dependent metalloprotease [Patulibacter minatonensis]